MNQAHQINDLCERLSIDSAHAIQLCAMTNECLDVSGGDLDMARELAADCASDRDYRLVSLILRSIH